MSQEGRRESCSCALAALACTPALPLAAAALILAAVSGSTAAAQEGSRAKPSASIASPPMPPLRPEQFAPPVAAPGPLPAPPSVVTPPGVDPMVANFAPDMPQELPAASRARMHKCGAEWQKMKETGAAAEKTWLEFARICLTH